MLNNFVIQRDKYVSKRENCLSKKILFKIVVI